MIIILNQIEKYSQKVTTKFCLSKTNFETIFSNKYFSNDFRNIYNRICFIP